MLTAFAMRCIARLLARCAGSNVSRPSRRVGISCVVECGPGKVLAGMVKRIDAELTGLRYMTRPAWLKRKVFCND
jgi:hypothetical protein